MRDVKMMTIDRTKPTSAPITQGRGLMRVSAAGARPPRLHTQPTAAVTSRTANRLTVFMTVSSTVMRSVCTAPAAGAAYMPSICACAAMFTPACCPAADAAGGGVNVG